MRFSATIVAAKNFTGSFQILRLSQKLTVLRKLRQKATSKLAFKRAFSKRCYHNNGNYSTFGYSLDSPILKLREIRQTFYFHLYLFVASVIFVVFLAPPDPDGPTHDQRGRNGFTTSGKSLLYPFRFLSIPTSYKQELIFCISLLCMFLDMYLGTWSPI